MDVRAAEGDERLFDVGIGEQHVFFFASPPSGERQRALFARRGEGVPAQSQIFQATRAA
jgi:hypothetical protein